MRGCTKGGHDLVLCVRKRPSSAILRPVEASEVTKESEYNV